MTMWDAEVAVGQEPPRELYLYLQQQPDGTWTVPRIHRPGGALYNMVATRATLPELHSEMKRMRRRLAGRKDAVRLFKFGHGNPIDIIDEAKLVATVEKEEARTARRQRREDVAEEPVLQTA